MELDFGCFISELAPLFASDDKLTFDLIVMARIGKGQTEILKQIEIEVSLCKKSGMHQPISWFTAKNIEFADSNLLSVL